MIKNEQNRTQKTSSAVQYNKNTISKVIV